MVERLQESYKKTEVGVIPKDWEVKQLDEICLKIQDGTHFSPKLGGNDYLYITSKNIGYGILDISNAARIDAIQHKEIFRRCDVRKGDLLLTKDGANTGNAVLNHLDEEFSLLSSVAFLRFEDQRHNPAYYLQQILAVTGQKRIKEQMIGNAITRITLDKIRKLKFPSPPTVSEQTVIAESLSDMDSLISSLEKLITKKQNIKQGAMQELLTGKKRLSRFEQKKGAYRKTEVGVIPEDWEVKTLGELFEITSSKRVFQSDWRNNGVPFYRARELAVLSEKGQIDNDLFISIEMYREYSTKFGVPKVNDLLVTGVGTLGKLYVVKENDKFYFKDGNIIWFKTTGETYSSFIKYLYQTPLLIKQIENFSAGTTVGTYTITNAKSTIIPVPSRPEQTAIAKILSDMDEEIEKLTVKLNKYKAIKQGMMQELLTGKRRLV